jgi:hypothetical protein
MDQRSGSGLNLHCSSDRSVVTSTTRTRDRSNYCRACSISMDSSVVILFSFVRTTCQPAGIDIQGGFLLVGFFHRGNSRDLAQPVPVAAWVSGEEKSGVLNTMEPCISIHLQCT